MYALILNVVIAFAFVAYTANSEKWCSKRPSVNLKTIPCDRIEQSDLCRCCPVDPCDGVTCMNGGECVGDGVCQCVSGYRGPTCSLSPCDGVECMNGGECVGEGVCNCTFGFGGPTCNLSPCDGVECMNGGECVGEGVCNCTFGFGGPTCNLSVCNATECSGRGGSCFVFTCASNGECGGTQCDVTDGKVCINDNCVVRNENCGQIDGIFNQCPIQGVPCGEGFCTRDVCVNNTCRFASSCTGQSDDTSCKLIGIGGTCLGGACLEPCRNDSVCLGYPCIGGFCANAKCGEQLCLGLGG